MRRLEITILMLAAAALSSCAPYIGSCSWVVPEAGAALKMFEDRKPIAGECECIGCDAPGLFVLEREKYELEFWNGDRWYPELYVRARTPEGEILFLSSDSPELIRMAPQVPARDTHGYEYFMRFDAEDAKAPATTMIVRVVDPSARVLGVETVTLRVETRKDLNSESL